MDLDGSGSETQLQDTDQKLLSARADNILPPVFATSVFAQKNPLFA